MLSAGSACCFLVLYQKLKQVFLENYTKVGKVNEVRSAFSFGNNRNFRNPCCQMIFFRTCTAGIARWYDVSVHTKMLCQVLFFSSSSSSLWMHAYAYAHALTKWVVLILLYYSICIHMNKQDRVKCAAQYLLRMQQKKCN